jgi:hypothetical protein
MTSPSIVVVSGSADEAGVDVDAASVGVDDPAVTGSGPASPQPTRTRTVTESRNRNGFLLGSTALDVFMKEVNRLGPIVAVPLVTHWECRTVLWIRAAVLRKC